jgi:3-hydroxyacyl-CoA dehydrogenase
MRLAKRMGKVGVVSGVCDGFIGNRMIEEYLRQAYQLLEEGALPQQVDQALQNWGMAMGPFAMSDMAGLDIGLAIRKRRLTEQPGRPYSAIPDLICELGRHGQKTSAGFYRYEQGSRVPVADPFIEQLIVDFSQHQGIARRVINDREIVERCILALTNEGAKILEEGIARRASDIDTVYVAGYGFPAHRGGPMFHADTQGLKNVLARMRQFQQGHQGHFWQPAPLLLELVDQGQQFNSL